MNSSKGCARDRETATELLPNRGHLGHRECRRLVTHGELVVPEPVGLVVDAKNQLVFADPIAIRRGPGPTTKHLEVRRIFTVMGAHEPEDFRIRGPVVARPDRRHDRVGSAVRLVSRIVPGSIGSLLVKSASSAVPDTTKLTPARTRLAHGTLRTRRSTALNCNLIISRHKWAGLWRRRLNRRGDSASRSVRRSWWVGRRSSEALVRWRVAGDC